MFAEYWFWKNYNLSFAVVLSSSREDWNLLWPMARVSSNPRSLNHRRMRLFEVDLQSLQGLICFRVVFSLLLEWRHFSPSRKPREFLSNLCLPWEAVLFNNDLLASQICPKFVYLFSFSGSSTSQHIPWGEEVALHA